MATSENGEGAEESGSVAPEMSGNCGAVGSEASVKWALTKNNEDSSNPTYTLTISGEGKMANLNNSTETENISDGAGTYPWANLKDSITKIVIDDGVTSIGSKAFISDTSFPMFTEVTFVYAINALLPMLVTPSSITIFVMLSFKLAQG